MGSKRPTPPPADGDKGQTPPPPPPAKRTRKRKPKADPPPRRRPASTAELTPDPRNPRFISDESAAGLSASLEAFGDLSGIVFNVGLNQLVAGHRRLEQIEAKWGPQQIEIIDADDERGMIRIDREHCFAVRIVDWPLEKHAAANVTANNPKIQGEFTDDVVAYMRDVETLLTQNSPSLAEDVLLEDLLAEFGERDPTDLKKVEVKKPPAIAWVLIGINTTGYGRIAELVERIAAMPGVIIETTLNDG